MKMLGDLSFLHQILALPDRIPVDTWIVMLKSYHQMGFFNFLIHVERTKKETCSTKSMEVIYKLV